MCMFGTREGQQEVCLHCTNLVPAYTGQCGCASNSAEKTGEGDVEKCSCRSVCWRAPRTEGGGHVKRHNEVPVALCVGNTAGVQPGSLSYGDGLNLPFCPWSWIMSLTIEYKHMHIHFLLLTYSLYISIHFWRIKLMLQAGAVDAVLMLARRWLEGHGASPFQGGKLILLTHSDHPELFFMPINIINMQPIVLFQGNFSCE